VTHHPAPGPVPNRQPGAGVFAPLAWYRAADPGHGYPLARAAGSVLPSSYRDHQAIRPSKIITAPARPGSPSLAHQASRHRQSHPTRPQGQRKTVGWRRCPASWSFEPFQCLAGRRLALGWALEAGLVANFFRAIKILTCMLPLALSLFNVYMLTRAARRQEIGARQDRRRILIN
jgi:hypothetical protein